MRLPANFQIATGKFSSGEYFCAGVYCYSGERRVLRPVTLNRNGETNIVPESPSCVILADRHTAVAEGIRGLLQTTFQTVYIVADTPSLREGASRLLPALIVLDMSLAGQDSSRMVQEIGELSPATRVLVLTVHDEATVARMVLGAGAHGVVIKRCIGNDLMQAVDVVLNGEKYASPDFGVALLVH